jgi:hypothetical protein
MNDRVRLQVAEAMGPVNRWYCSQAYGQPVEDPELLLVYFIKSGGAEDFARRFELAMDALNRWYCSEHHGCDIRDPKLLWDYYVRYGSESGRRDPRDGNPPSGRGIAC